MEYFEGTSKKTDVGADVASSSDIPDRPTDAPIVPNGLDATGDASTTETTDVLGEASDIEDAGTNIADSEEDFADSEDEFEENDTGESTDFGTTSIECADLSSVAAIDLTMTNELTPFEYDNYGVASQREIYFHLPNNFTFYSTFYMSHIRPFYFPNECITAKLFIAFSSRKWLVSLDKDFLLHGVKKDSSRSIEHYQINTNVAEQR